MNCGCGHFFLYSISINRDKTRGNVGAVVFDVAQRFSPAACSRPISCLTCLDLSHFTADVPSNPSNTDWNRLPSWQSPGIRPTFLQETLESWWEVIVAEKRKRNTASCMQVSPRALWDATDAAKQHRLMTGATGHWQRQEGMSSTQAKGSRNIFTKAIHLTLEGFKINFLSSWTFLLKLKFNVLFLTFIKRTQC